MKNNFKKSLGLLSVAVMFSAMASAEVVKSYEADEVSLDYLDPKGSEMVLSENNVEGNTHLLKRVKANVPMTLQPKEDEKVYVMTNRDTGEEEAYLLLQEVEPTEKELKLSMYDLHGKQLTPSKIHQFRKKK